MGFIIRAIKKELFSLATIFLVFIPLLNHSNAIPTAEDLASSTSYFMSEAPAQDVKGLMKGIGQAEANEVIKVLNIHRGPSYVVGHAPIFITGSTY